MARKKKTEAKEKINIHSKFNIGETVRWITKDKPCEICNIMLNHDKQIVYDIKVLANGHIYMHLVLENELDKEKE